MSTYSAPGHEPSSWLRERVTEALVHLAPGMDCGHPSPYAVLALWDGLLRCQLCHALAVHALRELDPAEDHTCDRCRTQVDSRVYALTLQCGGALYIAFGLCAGCLTSEGVGPDALG